MHMLLFLLAMGAQCAPDNTLNPTDKGDDIDVAPELVITPDIVDFGAHRRGEGDRQTISIENHGNQALELTAVALQADAGFELYASELDMELGPGEATEVEVVFTAYSLRHEAALVVESDDPETPRAIVPIEGQGLLPALWVNPVELDFGKVFPECAIENTLTIGNVGNDTLVLDTITQIGSNFELAELTLPLTLEPNEFEDLVVTFTPPDIEEYDSEIWFGGNIADTATVQLGTGALGSDYVDEYLQPIQGKADIMFWVDQSGSMLDDKAAMAAQFEKFIGELETKNADYLLMVVTGDTGCHNIAYIEPDTDDKSRIFTEALNGTGGIYTEAGLTVAAGAMKRSVPGQCNSRFRRENATVSVVLVSDEPEQSPPVIGWEGVVQEIMSASPSTYISAVAGPVPDGCATADAGYGYYEAALATGGLFLNICSLDWGEKLVNLAEQATTIKLGETFYLSYVPEPGTLQVFLDGTETTTGWTHDEELNAVVFDAGSIPGEGVTVQLKYSDVQTCEQ